MTDGQRQMHFQHNILKTTSFAPALLLAKDDSTSTITGRPTWSWVLVHRTPAERSRNDGADNATSSPAVIRLKQRHIRELVNTSRHNEHGWKFYTMHKFRCINPLQWDREMEESSADTRSNRWTYIERLKKKTRKIQAYGHETQRHAKSLQWTPLLPAAHHQ